MAVKVSGLQTFKSVQHPNDPQYKVARQEIIDDLLQLSEAQLGRYLQTLSLMEPPRDENGLTQKIASEIYNTPLTPQVVKNGLGYLDTTTGTNGGGVLIRQDLEPVLYALFVKRFPAFERIRKGQSNGLVHAATQVTTPDNGTSDGSSFISELGTVSYTTGAYNRVTFPIAVMANGRGVSIKEIAAAAAGGGPYNPEQAEHNNAMVKLARDAQWALFQGNATNSTGAGAATEAGVYNALAFDGLRGVIGSVGAFSGNNAVQMDIGGSLNFMNTVRTVAAKIAAAGGDPTLVFMSITAKQYLDIEQEDNVRYNSADSLVDLIPGVRVNSINYADGQLAIAPVPGTSIGSYNRTSDSVLVEDIYVLDESTLCLRWLYSENFTVLQIPTGVDGTLSDRLMIFGMWGLEQAAPVFTGKARRPM